MLTLIRWMERIGALALFAIMVLITVTAITRYALNWALPDADALSRHLLAIVVFWGFASACLRQEHIQLDLITKMLPKTLETRVVRLSIAITLLAVAGMTFAAWHRLGDLRASGETTYDLRLQLWPFYAVAFVGMVAAVLALGYILFSRDPETRLTDESSSGLDV